MKVEYLGRVWDAKIAYWAVWLTEDEIMFFQRVWPWARLFLRWLVPERWFNFRGGDDPNIMVGL